MNDLHELSIRFVTSPVPRLYVLDQRALPHKEVWLEAKTVEDMWQYIKQLSVRGAPLIAIAAILMLALQAKQSGILLCSVTQSTGVDKEKLIESAKYLKSSRPTAVNMMTACDAIIDLLKGSTTTLADVCVFIQKLVDKEIDMNESMAKHGASLIQDGESILTHCNTGSLATPGKGTALGVIKEAHLQNKNIHVYVDETRPLLQGARLTAYELQRAGIPYTIICDNMAATLMQQGKIQRVLVGADRIATNGDTANKIGTYSVAIVARYHGVPFHVVAPTSTVDFNCPSGTVQDPMF